MALYYQLKFPSTLIEYRSVSEWKGVVVISNFDSLEAALGSCLVCLGLNSPLHVCNYSSMHVQVPSAYRIRPDASYSEQECY